MTAVVTPLHRPQPGEGLATVRALHPAAGTGRPGTVDRPEGRPRLVVLDGGRSAEAARRRAVFRRRRLAVAVAAVALVALGVQVAPGVAAALTTPPTTGGQVTEPISTTRYVAQPGDTLWSIAARLPDHGDVRDAVDLLGEANGADQVVAGQSVRIPASLLAR
jgi:nucleoid-associated protein YgaU